MKISISEFRNIIKEQAVEIIKELRLSNKYKVGDVLIKLTKDNQVDISKKGKTIKIVDVSPSFDQRDLLKLAQKFSKKQKKSVIPEAIDKDAVRELELYATNDSTLYRQRFDIIAKNLGKKKKAGKFDKTLAVKAYLNSVPDIVKKYNKEFGSDISFDKETKVALAKELLSGYEDLINKYSK